MLPRIIILIMLMPWLAGCEAVVIAPADVSVPRTVQLLEHGRHTTLLLTAADQTRVRYAYGDWIWYVEGKQNLRTGLQALFLPSQAAFGRQPIGPEQPGEQLESVVGVGIEQAYKLRADAAQVDALLASLDRQFQASPAQPQYSLERHLWVVPHPRPYTFAYNSNHIVADWLRELGFVVHGNPAWGHWQIKMPQSAVE